MDSQFKNAPSDRVKIRIFHYRYKSSFIDGKFKKSSIRFMKKISVGRLLIGIFLLGIWSCATTPRTVNPYFEMPPEHLLKAERELFALALQQQKITNWNRL